MSDTKVDFLRYHILKLIVTSKYIKEIDETLTRLQVDKYGKESFKPFDGLLSYDVIKLIASQLVADGLKLTHDGFPVPATWELKQGEAISVDDWIRDTDVLSLMQ